MGEGEVLNPDERRQHPFCQTGCAVSGLGRRDPAFLSTGAQAYKRDRPAAHVHLLDAGHFALETHTNEIAAIVRSFLADHL